MVCPTCYNTTYKLEIDRKRRVNAAGDIICKIHLTELIVI
jgi:hypothetical protein